MDIEIWATDGGSQAASLHRHNNDPQLQSRDRRPPSLSAAVHTHVHPVHHRHAVYQASTRTRADVSTCLSITDCSSVADREGGRSFSFGRLSPHPPIVHLPPYVRLLLCKLQHRSPFFSSTLVGRSSSSPPPSCQPPLSSVLLY